MVKNQSQNILLHYPKKLTDKPIISNLIKEYDLTVNISKARIDQDEEGTMIIELSGTSKNINNGLKYLREIGVTYKPISKIVTWNQEKCTHCSACTVVCPVGALYIPDRSNMLITFDEKKCIACGLCVPACPYKAMDISE